MPVSRSARRIRADEWQQEMTTARDRRAFALLHLTLRQMRYSGPGAISPQELRSVPSKLNEEP